MTVIRTHKKKKSVRMRGTKTHGWGAMKKHRGSGHQGGVGNAGSGKRGDAKKPTYLKEKRVFGRHGFVRPNKKEVCAINIVELERKREYLLKAKVIQEEKGFTIIDLKKLGYDKLLATGNTKTKFKITAQYASANAIKKVQDAGGEVMVEKKAEETAKEAETAV
ncbi:uL15 family ribosomal protein [Candidatus Woesearchaeota archaeon]|nr:uL15 family ribosomal protein [Candidatus Woesearchaeota archaeon]